MGNNMTDKDRITALERQVADMKRELDAKPIEVDWPCHEGGTLHVTLPVKRITDIRTGTPYD